MANTYTANYNLTKPEVGADRDQWGAHHNANFDAIDAAIKAVSNVANAALPKTGGVVTGTTEFKGGAEVWLWRDQAGGGRWRFIPGTDSTLYMQAMSLDGATTEKSWSFNRASGDFASPGKLYGSAAVLSGASTIGGNNIHYQNFPGTANFAGDMVLAGAGGYLYAGGRVIVNNSRQDGAYVQMLDNDGSQGYLHYNNTEMGFLNNNGSWVLRSAANGQLWTAQLGDVQSYIYNTANDRAAAYASDKATYGYVNGTFINNLYIMEAYDYAFGYGGASEPFGPYLMTGVGYNGSSYIGRSRVTRRYFANGALYDISFTG
jgi:hypothetical protein